MQKATYLAKKKTNSRTCSAFARHPMRNGYNHEQRMCMNWTIIGFLLSDPAKSTRILEWFVYYVKVRLFDRKNRRREMKEVHQRLILCNVLNNSDSFLNKQIIVELLKKKNRQIVNCRTWYVIFEFRRILMWILIHMGNQYRDATITDDYYHYARSCLMALKFT